HARKIQGPPVRSQWMAYPDQHLVKVGLSSLLRESLDGLALYEPMPGQLRFHADNRMVRLVVGGNRSGKSACAAVEVARAACGCDPFGKYPKVPMRIYCVGKDQKHIGQVMYPLLFKEGAFKIIKDKKTGRWRAWTEKDPHKEAKPAPPLIPQRYIAEIAWENKKESVPSVVTLKNGTVMCFFSSNGKPPQGMA